MPKLRVHQINPADGSPGDVPTISADGTTVAFAPDGYREVLMTDGITSPPEPIWNEDGTDWLYSEVIS